MALYSISSIESCTSFFNAIEDVNFVEESKAFQHYISSNYLDDWM
jgi:hypothetical protein